MKLQVYFIVFLFLLFQNNNKVFAQIKCGKYPSYTQVFESLKYKPAKIDFRKLTPNCNINDSIRNRLLQLLNPQWTDVEIDKVVNDRLNENYNWLNIDELAQSIAKGNDSLFYIARDSIKNLKFIEYKNSINEYINLSTDGSIISAVAYLDMKETIPLLKRYFPNTNQIVVKTALARLGDEMLQKEIIQNCLPDTAFNNWDWVSDLQKKGDLLSFIGTQESIYNYSSWIDTSKVLYLNDYSKNSVKAANYVLIFLKSIILNEDFQTKLKLTFPVMSALYDLNYNNNEILLFCKDWLRRNKGKYLIKRSFYEW